MLPAPNARPALTPSVGIGIRAIVEPFRRFSLTTLRWRRNPQRVDVGEQRLRAATDIDHTRGVEPDRFSRCGRSRASSAGRGRRLRRVSVVSERDECDHDRDDDHRDCQRPPLAGRCRHDAPAAKRAPGRDRSRPAPVRVSPRPAHVATRHQLARAAPDPRARPAQSPNRSCQPLRDIGGVLVDAKLRGNPPAGAVQPDPERRARAAGHDRCVTRR